MCMVEARQGPGARPTGCHAVFCSFNGLGIDHHLVSLQSCLKGTHGPYRRFSFALGRGWLVTVVLLEQDSPAARSDRDISAVEHRYVALDFLRAWAAFGRMFHPVLVAAQHVGTAFIVCLGLFSGDTLPGVGILRPILLSVLLGGGSLAILFDHWCHRPGGGRRSHNWRPDPSMGAVFGRDGGLLRRACAGRCSLETGRCVPSA